MSPMIKTPFSLVVIHFSYG